MQQRVALKPGWLNGPAGRVLCVCFEPETIQSGRGLLIIPPFGEEMNKCRRMMALTARAAAAGGHRVALVDLFGTGDSEGDFADARLEIWIENLAAGARHLATLGVETLDVIAVRAGALLLDPSIADVGLEAGRLIFWQPVINGKQFASQFLRLRLAGELANGSSSGSVAGLWAEIDRVGSIEVVGYRVSRELMRSLEHRNLLDVLPTNWRQLAWFEIGATDTGTLSPAATRAVQSISARGVEISTRTLTGEPFWATPEIGIVHGLVQATADFLLPDVAVDA